MTVFNTFVKSNFPQQHSILCIEPHSNYMDVLVCNLFSVDGQLGFFQLYVLINEAAKDIIIDMLLCSAIYLGKILRS